MCGSSPLSRGIRALAAARPAARRIIPALAGNTGQAAHPDRDAPDHPRSRGEYVRAPTGGQPGGGSSPLSRGILAAGAGKAMGEGIIPALAGNTLSMLF